MQKLKIIFTLLLFLSSGLLYAETPIYTEEQKNITVTAEQPQFTIKLTANPTTGYQWSLGEYDKTQLELVKHEFITPENKQLIGAPGKESWTFKMIAKTPTTAKNVEIPFSYARQWEPEPIQQLVFNVTLLTQPAASTNDAE